MSNETIRRRNKNSNYTALDNKILQEQTLSYDALGMLVELLSRPLNWEVSIAQLSKRHKCGRDRVRRILQELIENGYVKQRERIHADGGRFVYTPYIVTETPFDFSDEPLTENPFTANPSTEKPFTANATQQNTDSTKDKQPQKTDKTLMPPAAKSAAGSAGTRDVDSTSADDISDDVLADDVAADDAGRVEESAAPKKPRPQTAAAALNEALLGALRIDVPTKSDYGKAGKVRKELADAYERATGQAMTPEDVRVFVAYVESEARKQNWTLTLTSLTNNGRLSAWLSTRPKNGASPTQNDAPTQYVPRPEWLNMSRREWAVQAVRDAIAQGWTVEAIAVAHDSTPDVVRALAEN